MSQSLIVLSSDATANLKPKGWEAIERTVEELSTEVIESAYYALSLRKFQLSF